MYGKKRLPLKKNIEVTLDSNNLMKYNKMREGLLRKGGTEENFMDYFGDDHQRKSLTIKQIQVIIKHII